jgi:hypothetical protein
MVSQSLGECDPSGQARGRVIRYTMTNSLPSGCTVEGSFVESAAHRIHCRGPHDLDDVR